MVMDSVQPDYANDLLRSAARCLKKVRTVDEIAAFGELEAMVDNLLEALEWSLSVGQSEMGARLALALGQYEQRRGLYRAAALYLDTGISLAESLPPAPPGATASDLDLLRAELLRERASLHLDLFEWQPATARASEAMHIFEAAGEFDEVCACLNLLGLAAFHRDELEPARGFFRQARDGCQRTGNLMCSGIVLHNMGLVESRDGNKDEAVRLLGLALAQRRANGDLRGLAETSNNLGVLAQERNSLDEAAEHYTAALVGENTLRHSFGMARALHNLGEVAHLRGDNPLACRLAAAAERLFEQVGSPYLSESAELLRSVAAAQGLSSSTVAGLRAALDDKTPGEIMDWALPEARGGG